MGSKCQRHSVKTVTQGKKTELAISLQYVVEQVTEDAAYSGFSYNENTDGIRGDFIFTRQILNQRIKASFNDFIWRL
jgi:hypothetical protein